VIDRDRIMRSVWPEVTISDDGVTQCVRDIRRALGDEAQRIVRTLPKRGYVLGVEVAHERADRVDAAHAAQDKPSIAVLPFVDLAADPTQTFFAEGIADDIGGSAAAVFAAGESGTRGVMSLLPEGRRMREAQDEDRAEHDDET